MARNASRGDSWLLKPHGVATAVVAHGRGVPLVDTDALLAHDGTEHDSELALLTLLKVNRRAAVRRANVARDGDVTLGPWEAHTRRVVDVGELLLLGASHDLVVAVVKLQGALLVGERLDAVPSVEPHVVIGDRGEEEVAVGVWTVLERVSVVLGDHVAAKGRRVDPLDLESLRRARDLGGLVRILGEERGLPEVVHHRRVGRARVVEEVLAVGQLTHVAQALLLQLLADASRAERRVEQQVGGLDVVGHEGVAFLGVRVLKADEAKVRDSLFEVGHFVMVVNVGAERRARVVDVRESLARVGAALVQDLGLSEALDDRLHLLGAGEASVANRNDAHIVVSLLHELLQDLALARVGVNLEGSRHAVVRDLV
mmetsp:Transcript_26452/g.46343  ORF Transcript_26452/g.46343 Transcript_26452/m.46343 type:complete len:371 (+) Transcript_26452:601-1713(+)